MQDLNDTLQLELKNKLWNRLPTNNRNNIYIYIYKLKKWNLCLTLRQVRGIQIHGAPKEISDLKRRLLPKIAVISVFGHPNSCTAEVYWCKETIQRAHPAMLLLSKTRPSNYKVKRACAAKQELNECLC